MAEEIQHLIDRIQTEAVDQAEAKAKAIHDEAGRKAAAVLKEAEKQREQILERAKEEAQQYTDRSVRTLEQVSRDLLISVAHGVEKLFTALVRESVDQALTIDQLRELLVRVTDKYLSDKTRAGQLEVLVSPEECEQLLQFYAERYREQLGKGVEFRADRSITKGFRVRLVDRHAEHDFTAEAIAESLARHLRPKLSEILLRVAKSPEPAATEAKTE